MSHARYLIGDVFDRMAEIPDGSIDLIVTSPPFLALRSYLPADHPDKHKEIGSEPTPAAFLDTLLALTAEWRRVLAPHGSICVELGDTYSGVGGTSSAPNPAYGEARSMERKSGDLLGAGNGWRKAEDLKAWPLDKSLAGIPTLYAWSLAYGRNLLDPTTTCDPWRIRNLLVWARPNPPVGALGDKWRPATSYVTVACVGRQRYFDLDAVRTPGSDHVGTFPGRSHYPGESGDRPGGPSAISGANPAGAPPLDWCDERGIDWQPLMPLPTQPYAGSHYACVDDQTEALTLNGWKPHSDLINGEMIAAYNAEDGTLRWEPATFHRYPFDGELVTIDQRETVQRLTPQHRTLIRTRDRFERTIRADQVKASHAVPLIAPWVPDRTRSRGVDWSALCGWWVTEGHMPKGGRRAVIDQSETANPQHVETIRGLLESVDAEWTEKRREREWRGRPAVGIEFRITGRVADELRRFGKAIPPGVLSWHPADIEVFARALIDGDGHRRENGREQFVTASKHDADMFQAIMARLGKRSTISERHGGTFSVSVGRRSWATLRGTNGAARGTGRESYTGVVWCPSVESTYWLARRNGRPFITGNTFPTQLPKRLIECMCPQKVCTVCGKPSVRITQATENYAEHLGTSWADRDDGRAKAVGRERNSHSGQPKGVHITAAQRETLGWTDCGCSTDGTHWRNGIVLDPFGGSGTTAVAATGLGRDCVLVDLDIRNADLARDRVGMFLEVQG